MEEEETTSTPAKLEEQEVAAIATILIRTIRAQDEIVIDRELIKSANERIAVNNRIRSSAYQALKVFGFDGPEDVNLWDLVHDVMPLEYDRAIAIARGQIPALLTDEGSSRSTAERATLPRSVPVRVAILDYLRTQRPEGVQVAQVKQHLQDRYGLTVHEKTPGMTLYRLPKEGIVRRQGRTWFAVEEIENKGNEAPAVDTEDASETALTAQ